MNKYIVWKIYLHYNTKEAKKFYETVSKPNRNICAKTCIRNQQTSDTNIYISAKTLSLTANINSIHNKKALRVKLDYTETHNVFSYKCTGKFSTL